MGEEIAKQVESAKGPGDEEFVVLPPEGPSREEIEYSFFPMPEYVPPPKSPSSRPQFSLADVMMITFAVAAGLAGGSWMPSDVFAAVLGLITLIGLLVVHLHPPETHAAKLVWAALVIAYVMAVFAALLKPTDQALSLVQPKTIQPASVDLLHLLSRDCHCGRSAKARV